jgi:hypothetical protein
MSMPIQTFSKRGVLMFGVEDLTRIRIEEARQEGLRSQYVHRNLGEKQKLVSKRLLEVIVATILHIITLKT